MTSNVKDLSARLRRRPEAEELGDDGDRRARAAEVWRDVHGTRERRPWQAQPVPGATGMQNVPVERRVVGGDERRVVDPGAERRPQLGEGPVAMSTCVLVCSSAG